jgi:glucosamine--fructose-6-phosphate aminotransferase (isomerizing)
VLSVVNVPESSIARASDVVLETVAGPEVSVASTKAFTAQLSVLACLALSAGQARGTVSPARASAMMTSLLQVPALAEQVLSRHDEIQVLAQRVSLARDVLYLGRGNCFPIALEGAV